MKLAGRRSTKRANNHFQAGGIGRDSKGEGVIFILLCQIPRWQHNNLIYIGSAGRMRFRTTNNYPIFPFFNHTHIVVRMRLFGGVQTSIAFHIGLGNRHTEIFPLTVLVIRLHPLEVVRTVLCINPLGDQREGKECVRSNLFN